MGAYAWYYNDHEADVCYWAYSYGNTGDGSLCSDKTPQ